MRCLVPVGLLAPAVLAAVVNLNISSSPSQSLTQSLPVSLAPSESLPAGVHGGSRLAALSRLLGLDPLYPFDPRASPFCTWWYDYEGQPWEPSCEEIPGLAGITRAQWVLWNPVLAESCDNYVPFNSYCVEAFHHPEPVPTTTSTSTSTGQQPPTTTTTTTNNPPTTTDPGNGITTPTPIQDGMVTNCNKFQPVRETTTCTSIVNWTGITFAQLLKWNPGIGANCESLWIGTHACVGVIDDDEPPGNGIETPLPIQPGMVTNCNKFQPVRETTTCESIVNWTGITFAQLLRWNPGIGANCESLWRGTNACVGVIGGDDQPPTPTTNPGNGITTPSPVQSGIPTNCNKFQPVRETTTCDSIINWTKIDRRDFHAWNPSVGTNCQNLQVGTNACVGVIDNTVRNGIPTPLPIQPDMATNCNKFQPVRATTTCDSIINYNRITWAEFLSWNPNVGTNCQNLQVGTNSCVGVVDNTARNGISTPTPIQAGMVSNCNRFATVRPTTTCQGILDWNSISLADFVKWNPAVGATCGNLWSNTFACIGVIGGSPTPTQPPTGVTTPTPTQAGMVPGCTKFAQIRPTTTCQGVLDWNGITLANFVKWNPAVGSNCQNLWANTWACIAGP